MTETSLKISASNQQKLSFELLDISINEEEIIKKIDQIRLKASTLKKSDKIPWLLKAISLTDLTTLSGADTAITVRAICAKALKPIKNLEFTWNEPLHTAAVCVYPARIQDAVSALQNSDISHNISVASVAGGFPSGQYPLETRLSEIHYAVQNGATEIDVVINRPLALTHNWKNLYEELCLIRKACGTTCMKTILATGELSTLENIYKASMIAMMAGTDFIKTSTGKEVINATLPAGIVMCKAIKNYYKWAERKVGFKPAGGIKTATDALEWMILVKEELDDSWLNKNLFRIGASSVVDDISKVINAELKENPLELKL